MAGNGSFPGTRQVHDLFQDGDWVDYREIPVVSGSVSATDVENAFFQLTFANLVNYAWRQQVIYLACYPMSQETCECLPYLLMPYPSPELSVMLICRVSLGS
mgnify:CR=1 FL=1